MIFPRSRIFYHHAFFQFTKVVLNIVKFSISLFISLFHRVKEMLNQLSAADISCSSILYLLENILRNV